MRIYLSICSLFFFCLSANAQDFPTSEEAYEKQYFKNIKKSRLNGVYIPKDMEDAFKELEALSPAEAVMKFKNAEEEWVVRKLHFGIGRWLHVNWNFEMGSRFSHYLKSMGVSHPDDMIDFTLSSWHRHLNEKPLDLKKRAIEYAKKRKALSREKFKDAEIIKKTKKDKPPSDQG